jgi:hypothetical protein
MTLRENGQCWIREMDLREESTYAITYESNEMATVAIAAPIQSISVRILVHTLVAGSSRGRPQMAATTRAKLTIVAM